jgi:hypothetical protein
VLDLQIAPTLLARADLADTAWLTQASAFGSRGEDRGGGATRKHGARLNLWPIIFFDPRPRLFLARSVCEMSASSEQKTMQSDCPIGDCPITKDPDNQPQLKMN